MQAYSQYFANDRDAREYQFKHVIYSILLFASLAAYAQGFLSTLWMVLLVSALTTRWMIAIHELFHLRRSEDLNFFVRLQFLPLSPIGLGYREYQQIHIGHHKYAASEQDPDAFHILGGPMKALFGSITQNEQATIRYFAAHGLKMELPLMMLLRAGIFFGLLWTIPQAFIAWWLTLRVTYIVSDFVFFHLVHYSGGKLGTFRRLLPSWLAVIAKFLYGSDVVDATMYHDIHHQYNMIAPKYMPRVAREMAAAEA